jgi:octaprenyl-diphosphate synthase
VASDASKYRTSLMGYFQAQYPAIIEEVCMNLKPIRKLIEPDLQVVEGLIRESLKSKVDLTQIIGEYVVSAGGKRIRALLCILAARTLGYEGNGHHLLAAIIEIIHTATLLHDDVVDASELRRGRPSANAIYGNMASVLCGDFLYSKAFELMIELERLEILAELARVSNTLAEGEMLQLQSCHYPELTEAEYFAIISQKTASLFEASCKIPCLLRDEDASWQSAFTEYGKNIGFAFQIIDDALDYMSESKTMGKNPGDDLAEGKMTLPLIYAYAHAAKTDQSLISKAVRAGDTSQLNKIKAIIKDTGALDYTMQKAQEFVQAAQKSLEQIPDSVYKKALIDLSALTLKRNQ